MPYRPKLDPKVDLAGATPETLVRALFRPLMRSKKPREKPADEPREKEPGPPVGRVLFQRGSPQKGGGSSED